MEGGKVRFCRVNDHIETGVEILEFIETCEDLHLVTACGNNDFTGLIAVYAIDTNEGVMA